MKNAEFRNKDRARRAMKFFFIIYFAFFICLARADDQFGDISISAQAIYTGNTFHGYAEARVILENHSIGKSHNVSLVYPNNSYGGYGNSINRLSRTVTLAPGAREIISLLQPPLPISGDSQIRLAVDNHFEGYIHAPNANNHISAYNRSGSSVVFISRSLDSEAVEHVFNARHGVFTATMAVGAPDAGTGGFQPNAWMPDTRRYGDTNWLELDYAPPLPANNIIIYSPMPPTLAGDIILKGVSGTNLAIISMSSGKTSVYGGPRGRMARMQTSFSFPPTSEPVNTVRLNFGVIPPSAISVDAVQISGPSGGAYASAARASSDNSAAAPSYSPGGGGADSIESLRAESPVSEWSENWLAYTPFDAIVLDAADFNSLPPAVLAAVGNYLEAGGNVFIFGGGDFPAAWHSAQKKSQADGVEYRVGFGMCFVSPTKNFSALDTKTFQFLRDAVSNAARYWQNLPDNGGAANAALPVVENLKIPVRGIVVIMLAFIIVIGPANIIILSRRNRRTWMLWTIPAISFATTLIVFAYSLVREGITPDTRITGVTVLDQINHHAATLGATAFYCPLTPSDGLRFEDETEVTPLVQVGNGSGTSREVDWTQSQHFQHGWISARVPAHFHLRKSETRRERLQIVNENGKFQVINGLGAPIKSLWVADADMNFYEAGNVAAGEKAGLILSKQPPASEKSGAEGLSHDFGFAVTRIDDLNASADKYLLPNTFIAVLDGNPFIENALGSASSPKRTKSSSVVFGILDSTDTK
jgi:hypothetical protein